LESLTDPARLALKQEMERRGMHVEHKEGRTRDNSAHAQEESASDNSIYSSEFITIREFDFRGEAMVVQGFLESAGIETLLLNTLNLPLNSMPFNRIGFLFAVQVSSGSRVFEACS